MRRTYMLPLLLAACSYTGPEPLGDDEGPPDPADRCDLDDTWADGKVPSRTLHVSATAPPGGSPDGTPEKPFRTIAAALGAVTPGTRILLGPGTHAGFTATEVRGQLDAPIWLEGQGSGGSAVIDGGPNGPGIHLIRPQHWVIRDLTVKAGSRPGINVDDGGQPTVDTHHIVIEKVTVSPVGNNACIKLSGVTDVVIRDATAAACNRGVMLVGVQHASIARMNIGGVKEMGVVMAGGSADIEVRQSVISDVQTGMGVWIGGESELTEFRPRLSAPAGNTEARDIRVFDNVIRKVRDAIQCSNCREALVAHNLIREVTGAVFRLHQPYEAIDPFEFAPAGDVELANNAIEAAAPAGEMVLGEDTDPASCTFRNNLWQRGGAMWRPMLPSVEERGIYDRPSGYGADGKLCQSANSATAGAGTKLTEVLGTLWGVCRPATPSIGPSEPDPGC